MQNHTNSRNATRDAYSSHGASNIHFWFTIKTKMSGIRAERTGQDRSHTTLTLRPMAEAIHKHVRRCYAIITRGWLHAGHEYTIHLCPDGSQNARVASILGKTGPPETVPGADETAQVWDGEEVHESNMEARGHHHQSTPLLLDHHQGRTR